MKKYQIACQNGTISTEQFDTIMHKASSSAIEYSAKIKTGTGTAQSYANAQRANNVALQEVSIGAGIASKAVKLFSATINMIAFTAIIQGISWLIGKVDEWIVTAEEAKVSADAFKESLSSFFSETQSNLKTITSLSDRFNELSKNVDANGKQIGGTTEEYDEFLSICEQVGQIMPELITGHTSEGQAIITLRGEVDSLTESYKNAIRAKAALFLSNGDDEGNTIESFFDDYNNFVQGDKGFLGLKMSPSGQNTADEFEQYYGYNQIYGWLSDVTDATLEDLQSLRAGTTEYVYLARVLKEAGYEISEISADNYNAIHDVFNSRMAVMEQGMTDRVTNIKNAFQNMLYADSEYWEIDDDNIISAINSVYASIDDEFIKQNNLFNKTALQTFESDLVSLFTNDATKQAMLNFYAPMSDEETVKEYTDRVTSALNTVQAYCDENGIIIPIKMGDSSEGVDSLIENVKKKLKGTEFDDKVGELSLGNLTIAADLEVGDDTIQSWDELIELIEKVKSETYNDETDILSSDKLKEQVDTLNSSIAEIQSAYDTIQSATEEYNSQGYLSPDTIQSLLAMDNAYLACLINENGQLVLNAATLNALTQAKLSEAEATAVAQAMTELNAIANGEAAVSTANYITGNANLMQSLGLLAGQYTNVANAAITAAQAQELSAAVKAANEKDSDATANVMAGLNAKLGLIRSTASSISTKGLGNISSMKSDSGGSSAGASTSAQKTMEEIQREWKDYLDKYLALYKAELDSGLIDFDTFLNKSRSMLDEFYRDGKISAKDYWDSVKSLYEDQLSIYDSVLSAVTRCFDNEIDSIRDIIDGLEDQNDTLQKQLDEYDSILSVVDDVYDREIDRIREQQDAIDDTISRLQEENDQNQQAIELEKAKYQLYNAQNNRNVKLFNGNEFVYEANQDDIREAQENLADLELKQTIDALEKQKDALDSQIEKLEEFKEKWAEIANAYDEEVNRQLAIALFGEDYESFILSNRTEDIENFRDNYTSIQQQMDDNQGLIDSYNEKIEYYELLKEQWTAVSDSYKQSQEDQYAAMLLGAQWENEILSGRIDVLNNFKDQYVAIQAAITAAALEAAKAQAEAQSAQSGSTTSGSSGSGGGGGNNSSPPPSNPPTDPHPDKYWVYKQLGSNYKTQGEANSKIGLYGGDAVIKVGSGENPWRVIKWLKGYTTSGEAHAQIGILNGTDVYKRYAKGTPHARKGLHLVSEDQYGDELIIQKDGNAVIAKGEQLYSFEGGETVINASETRKILSNMDNLIPLQKDAIPLSHLKIPRIDYASMVMNNLHLPNYSSLVPANQNISTSVTIGDIHLHEVQNVDTFANSIIRELPSKVIQRLGK